MIDRRLSNCLRILTVTLIPWTSVIPLWPADSAVPGDFVTIQAAIDDAGTVAGDTITVASGTHTETGILVSKAVTIAGMGLANTTVDGSGGNCFTLLTSDVTIRDLTISGASQSVRLDGGGTIDGTTVESVRMEAFSSRGIEIHTGTTATDVVVDSCQFQGATGAGIRLAQTAHLDGLQLLDSIVDGADGMQIGLYVANDAGTSTASNVTVTGTTFQNITSGQGTAIFVEELQNASIDGNIFIDNRRDIQLFKWYQAGVEMANVSITNNTMSGTTNAVFALFNAEHSSGQTVFNGITFAYNTATNIDAAVYAGAHDDALGAGGVGWDTVVIGCNTFTGVTGAGLGVRYFYPGVAEDQELGGASLDIVRNWWGTGDSASITTWMENPGITDYQPYLTSQPSASCVLAPVFVDDDVAPGGDGRTWSTAFDTLQDGLAAAAAGDSVWVAEGVYYPDLGGNQLGDSVTSTFTITEGVEVYGGFSGTEDQLGQRDPSTNITVLSGDIDGDDTVDADGVTQHWDHLAGSNAWHVVTATGTTSATVIDGVTITAGKASGGGADNNGAALVCSGATPVLSNLRVIGNHCFDRATFSACPTTITSSLFEANLAQDVGGIAQVAATYIDTVFTGNRANGQGALFYLGGGTLTMTNCQVVGNSNSNTGSIRAHGTTLDFDNVLFSGNIALKGAAIDLTGNAGGTIINSTFTGNRAFGDGGAIRFVSTGTLEVTNSIFWDNQDSSGTSTLAGSLFDAGNGAVTVTTSVLQGSGGSAVWSAGTINNGGGNLDDDPDFISAIDPGTAATVDGDFHLLDGSPAVNSGDDSAVTVFTDLDGEDRIQDGTVDMGAYEGALPWADLGVTKTDGVTSVVAGTSVTYTIHATNIGPSQADLVSLVDVFPLGVLCFWTSISSGGAAGHSSSAGDLGDALTMPAGSAVTYTVTCGINSAHAGGTLSNTVTVSSPLYDPVPSNNSATDDDTEIQFAGDLGISKDNGVGAVTAGQTVTYTVAVSNAGPSQIVGAVVSDILPPEITSCSWSCQPGPNTSCGPALTTNLSDSPDLDALTAVTYTGVCTVGPSTTVTSVSNTATVQPAAGTTDPFLGNNSATDVDLGPLIFFDGFESGFSPWSSTIGGPVSILVDSCADGPHIGTPPLPLISTQFDPVAANFDTTACGATSGQPDAVYCFTPTSSCTVSITSDLVTRSDSERCCLHWLSIFSGGCTSTPAGCVATDVDSNTPSVPSLAVNAGETYCVVVQTDSGNPVSVVMEEISGSCW